MLFRIEQQMGFGDAVALTAVLRHLRHYEPAARIELVCSPGREPLYSAELADEVTSTPDYRRPPTHRIRWPLPRNSYAGIPSTYVERYLIEQLRLQPIEALCRYQVPVPDYGRARARAWLEKALGVRGQGSGPVALCHFRGASMKDAKDVDDYSAAAIVAVLEAHGFGVLIWDAGEPSPLPDQGIGRRVPSEPGELFRLLGTDNLPAWKRPLDCGILAGLIAECDLFVGVDSGPLHLASAIGANAIGLWTRQNPVHCIAPDETTTHLVLTNGRREFKRFLIWPPIDDGLAYFERAYQHRWCDSFAPAIAELLGAQSPAPND